MIWSPACEWQARFNSSMKQCYVRHVWKGLLLMHRKWHYTVSKGWALNPAPCWKRHLLHRRVIYIWNIYLGWVDGCTQRPQTQPAHPATHQPPSGLTFSTSTLKIEMRSSPPGQKTSLTQETELLESLLQEVEHQVGLQQLTASIVVLLLVEICGGF